MKNEKQRPVWETKLHQLRVSVWENRDSKGGLFYNTSVIRRYQQGTEWRETNQLTGQADLALAIEGLKMALDFVRRAEGEAPSDAGNDW